MVDASTAADALSVERTLDVELVRSIITLPEVYPHVSDDMGLPVEQYSPAAMMRAESTYCLLVRWESDVLGVWVTHRLNGITWEAHTCVRPQHWGPHVRDGARACIAWMFGHTACRKIITHVPHYNRLALKLARDCGMQLEGCNRASWLKGGMLYDQYLLGIVKE